MGDRKLGAHAAVMGASVAGLVSARVLADFFDRVTVFERDTQPRTPTPRKGVPQSAHVHAMLAGGAEGLEALFPGLQGELIACGASRVDFLNEVAFFQGGWLGPAPGRRLDMFFQGRPLLEWLLDRRVRSTPGVVFREDTGVSAFAVDPSGRRVDGVELDRGGEVATADLVVDATGRGSRTPAWLLDEGFDAPPEEELQLPLSYTSRVFRDLSTTPWWKALFIAEEVDANRSGGIFPTEGGHWLVTLVGVAGEPAPRSDGEFLAFAKAFAVPELYNAIAGAEPLSPRSTTYRFPSSLRRRYEKCRRYPERLVVLGDAACSFDPRFGQGMSVAVLEALALQRALTAERGQLGPFGPKFSRQVARVVDLAWNPVVSEGLRHPAAVGVRTGRARALQWYSRRLMNRQLDDPTLKETLWRVSQFLEAPTALVRPRVLWKALRPRKAG